MEGNIQGQATKKTIFKKWWFWVTVAVASMVVLGIFGVILIKTGAVDAGVNVSVASEKYEPSFYYQNTEYKVCYELDDFKSSSTKTRVDDNNYVYYDVTLSFSFKCQLTLNGKKYNDDRIDFTPCIVFYSTNNSNFEKVIKTMTVNSGHTYNYSFTINDVCGGKDKELASYNYYVKVSVPANE